MSQWAPPTCSAWQRRFEEHVGPIDSFFSDLLCEFDRSSDSAFNEPNSVLELSAATVFLSALHSDAQESEYRCRNSCGRMLDMHSGEGVTVSSYKDSGNSGLEKNDVIQSFANNSFLCGAGFEWKIIDSDNLSQSLTEVSEMDDLFGSVHNARATYRTDVGFDNGAAEWTDSLIGDLQPENGDLVAISGLDADPCESTEGSEPLVAMNGSIYRDENDLSDGTFALDKAAQNTPNFSAQVSTSWTQDTGNEALGPRDVLSSSSSMKEEGQRCPMPHEFQKPWKLCYEQVNRGSIESFACPCPILLKNVQGVTKVASPDIESPIGKFRSDDHQARVRETDVIQLLLVCAQVIDSVHGEAANVLATLRSLSSRNGDPIRRLAAYFTEALSMRLAVAKKCPVGTSSTWRNECSPQVLTMAYKALNEACPYFAFAQLTANQAIVEAIESADKVHIIDFGFGLAQGVQWVALLQAIANKERNRRPTRIRITVVGSAEAESLTGAVERLVKFGKLMDLTVEVRVVEATPTEEEVAVEEGELVAVNLMLGLCNLGGGGREATAVMKMLRVAERVAPVVVVVAEMEAPLNAGGGENRFLNILQFYAAVFESLDACMPRECEHRLNMERWLMGQNMDRLVEAATERRYCEYDWRGALEGAGFRVCPPSHYAVSQARALGWRFSEAFTLLHEPDTFSLSLGWQNRPLVRVSAWSSRSCATP